MHTRRGVVGPPVGDEHLGIMQSLLTVGRCNAIMRGLLEPRPQKEVSIGLQQAVLQLQQGDKLFALLQQDVSVLLAIGLHGRGIYAASMVGHHLSGQVYEVVSIGFAARIFVGCLAEEPQSLVQPRRVVLHLLGTPGGYAGDL